MGEAGPLDLDEVACRPVGHSFYNEAITRLARGRLGRAQFFVSSALRTVTLQIIHYPHPTLNYKSKPVKRVDAELRGMIAEMFDLMYAARGIGLAANQVGIPLRFFVMNLAGAKGEGEELVFINPTISRTTGADEAEEGCLSLPGVYGPVLRPAEVLFSAYMPNGEKFEQKVSGMFARCVQHETDHLDGIMFIERMDDDSLYQIQPEVDQFELTFERLRSEGKLPTDQEITAFQNDIEAKYA